MDNEEKASHQARQLGELTNELKNVLIDFMNEKMKEYKPKIAAICDTEILNSLAGLMIMNRIFASAMAQFIASGFLSFDAHFFKLSKGIINIDYLKEIVDDTYKNYIEDNIETILAMRKKVNHD